MAVDVDGICHNFPLHFSPKIPVVPHKLISSSSRYGLIISTHNTWRQKKIFPSEVPLNAYVIETVQDKYKLLLSSKLVSSRTIEINYSGMILEIQRKTTINNIIFYVRVDM
jgi:hypothetical protein